MNEKTEKEYKSEKIRKNRKANIFLWIWYKNEIIWKLLKNLKSGIREKNSGQKPGIMLK